MGNLIIEFPDAATTLDEALDRLMQLIVKQHETARKALAKANNYASVGHAEDSCGWALEASDAHRRAAILEDAWEAIAGKPWNCDWGVPD